MRPSIWLELQSSNAHGFAGLYSTAARSLAFGSRNSRKFLVVSPLQKDSRRLSVRTTIDTLFLALISRRLRSVLTNVHQVD